MRIVVLGTDHLIGGSIVRFLIKMREKAPIVICSKSGNPPEGTFFRENVHKATITSVDDLRSLLKKGDIVYNGEVNTKLFGTTPPQELLSLHSQGIVNLLGVANEIGVSKVITYLPGFLTWAPKGAISEDKHQSPMDEAQLSYLSALKVCYNYWEGLYLGYWTDSDEFYNENLIDKNESIPHYSYRTDLVLVRGGILFGPFETEITSTFWKGVKLGRLEIEGKGTSKVSWSNPEDIAIAMIQANNFNVKGEFYVKSFDASPRTLIKAMDNFYHSETKLRTKTTLVNRFLIWLKTQFSAAKIHSGIASYYIFSKNLVINDSKARDEMRWDTQKPIDITIKESFTWFNDFFLKSSQKESYH